jgi:hypothetical protein
MTNIEQICAQIIELWDDECYDINTEINELRAALTEPEPEGRRMRRSTTYVQSTVSVTKTAKAWSACC